MSVLVIVLVVSVEKIVVDESVSDIVKNVLPFAAIFGVAVAVIIFIITIRFWRNLQILAPRDSLAGTWQK